MYAEFDLIEQICVLFDPPEGVVAGIGDDCAVLEAGQYDLVTTDTVVEGVHFRREWSTAADIGFKALTVSLSDVAAMGGRPGVFFLNLSLSVDEDEAFVDGLLAGMKQACDQWEARGFNVSVGGGDITCIDGPAVVSTTCMGQAPPGGPVLRSGAKPGDRLVVFGPTGLAEAGLDLLAGRLEHDPGDFPALLEAHRRPRAMVGRGAAIGAAGLASAMVDVSDGLAGDVAHLVKSSQVQAVIDTGRLPRHDQLVGLCGGVNDQLVDYQIGGGEDFGLCATVPPTRLGELRDTGRLEGWDIFDVGEIRPPDVGPQVVTAEGRAIPIDSRGFTHF